MSEYLDAQTTIDTACLIDAQSGKTTTIAKLTDEIGLSPAHFTNFQLQSLYTAIQKAYIALAAGGTAELTINDILSELEREYRSNGHAQQAGQYIEEWRGKIAAGLPMPGNILEAARHLQNAAVVRQIKEDHVKLYEDVRTADDAASKLSDWVAYLGQLAAASTGIANKPTQIMSDIPHHPPISSGIPWVDDSVLFHAWYGEGGFSSQTMVAWLCPSGQGKSSTAATFTSLRALQNFPVIFETAEESPQLVAARVLCATAKAPKYMSLLRKPIVQALAEGKILPQAQRAIDKARAREMQITDEDATLYAKALLEAYKILDQYVRIYKIDDVKAIGQHVRRHRMEFGDLPILLIVDHIGELDRAQTSNWSRDLGIITGSLRRIIDDPALNTAGLIYSQVPAEMEKELREKNFTTLKDARGSRDIRNKADYVIVSCRHNGRLKDPDTGKWYGPIKEYSSATVIQGTKNRMATEISRHPRGVLDFDPRYSLLTPYVIEDDSPRTMAAVPEPSPVEFD